MTFGEFVRLWQLVEADFDRAVWAHYTAVYINEAAKNSKRVFSRLNRDARFWNYEMDCLQCGFFMALGRLFDTGSPDALTIYSLVDHAGRHAPSLFSRTALAARKRAAGLSVAQVDTYMEGVRADPRKVIKRLRRHLSEAKKIYDSKYRGVRNEVFGHAIAAHRFRIDALYGQTNFIEVDKILYRIHEVLQGLFALMHDGRERDLDTSPPLYPHEIRNEVRHIFGLAPKAAGGRWVRTSRSARKR